MVSRHYFLLLCFTVQFFLYACNNYDRPPNIILITIDDLGWTDLGCYGSSYYETPHIDQLAKEGVRFTNAYAAAAICSPTRAAIQTGKYPARVGITDWIRARFQGGGEDNRTGFQENTDKNLRTPFNPFHMELKEVTIAEILKRDGYSTCHIGKWHLGTEKWYPEKQGYDLNRAGCDYGQPPSYFDPYVSYPNQWQKDTLNGFPTLLARQKGEYLTDREGDEAVAFIRMYQDQSFFLNLCHYAVHTPIQAKSELVRKYEAKAVTNQKSPEYAAMVESVDETLGMIKQTLIDLDLDTRTIIIFTSDNGGLLNDIATSNEPLRSGKGYPYEGGIRIPTIIWWPEQIRSGAIADDPVISMDILPTICDIAHIDYHGSDILDGISLLPLLKNGIPIERNSLFWHFPHYRGSDIVPYSIIRQGDWKLIKRYDGDTFELFNLGNDLSEKNELSDNYPDLVGELDQELQEWLNLVGARIPQVKNDSCE